MKEIRETKLVEQTTVKFVADDGKIFEGEGAERECKNHERIMNWNKLEEDYKALKPVTIETNLFSWWQCSARIDIVIANDQYDFDTINNYFHKYTGGGNEIEEPKEYPYKFVIVGDECYCSEYKSNNDDPATLTLVNEISEGLDKLSKAHQM